MVRFALALKWQRTNWIRLETNTIVSPSEYIWSKTMLKGHRGANCRPPNPRELEKLVILQWQKYCVLLRQEC